jgi:hypothetical protein
VRLRALAGAACAARPAAPEAEVEVGIPLWGGLDGKGRLRLTGGMAMGLQVYLGGGASWAHQGSQGGRCDAGSSSIARSAGRFSAGVRSGAWLCEGGSYQPRMRSSGCLK